MSSLGENKYNFASTAARDGTNLNGLGYKLSSDYGTPTKQGYSCPNVPESSERMATQEELASPTHQIVVTRMALGSVVEMLRMLAATWHPEC